MKDRYSCRKGEVYPPSGWRARECSQADDSCTEGSPEIDSQCRSQAEAAGLEVDNLTVADITYPLIAKRVVCVFHQQLSNMATFQMTLITCPM